MMVGIGADLGGRLDPGTRLEAVFLTEFLVADQNSRRTIDDARAVARVVDVIDPLKMRVFQHRNLVEAGHLLTHHREGGVQRAEALHVGAGAHVLVAIQNGQAVLVLDGDDRFLETVVFPCRCGALSAIQPPARQRHHG